MGRRALVFAFFVVFLTGCGASSASYTRFRREAESGRVVAAEEVRASEFIAYHAQSDAPRPPMTAPGAGSGLAVDARVGDPVLPAVGSRPVLQVALRGTAGVTRRPANVVIAVDLSGSMNEGDKIGAVRHAVSRFVEALDPQDQVSIVTFADGAAGIGPRPVGTERAAILAAVGRWRAGGGTNIYAGLEQALRHALAGQRAGITGVSRVVLLSDGMPTTGITDRGQILALAAELERHGVSVTTVGLGDQIDDALLSGIARVTGGQYRYLDRPDEVERVFAAEIRGLTEGAARDVELRVSLPPGWGFHRVYDERSSLPDGRTAVTRVGEVAGDEAVVLVYELEAPPGPPGERRQIVVDLAFASPEDRGRRAAARAVVEVSRSAALAYHPAPGGVILRNLMLGRAAHALREADLLRRRGDPSGAALLVGGVADQMDQARARLAASGGDALAASLDEPTRLLRRTHATLVGEARAARSPAPPAGSATWSDWAPSGGTVVIPATEPCVGCVGPYGY